MAEVLSGAELHSSLAGLPGWKADGSEIAKAFSFPSYMAGIEFVNSLACEAEAMNHHPDLVIGWRNVTVRLSTHSKGGVTGLDLRLAGIADEISRRMAG